MFVYYRYIDMDKFKGDTQYDSMKISTPTICMHVDAYIYNIYIEIDEHI